MSTHGSQGSFGTVSGEGGPLVIADAVDLHNWSGAEGSAYELACAFLDEPGNEEGGSLMVENSKFLLWELRGGGTADLFKVGEDCYLIVRIWPHGPYAASTEFAEVPRNLDSLYLGTIHVRSGFLGVLWAPENGNCIRKIEDGRPSGDMALDDGAWVFQCPPGQYSFWHDELRMVVGNSRRCWVEWQGP